MRRSPWLLLPVMMILAPNLARGDGADDVLDKAPSKFAKSGDLKVHYKSLGDGKTALVFVHGWCCDHTVWRAQAAALDGKVRMVFVDLPGYGKSDRPKIDYTMDVFARGIDAVLQDAGVDQAALAGHSMGTPIVRQYYRLYPKKTRALIFVDGALRSFTKEPAEAEKFLSMFKEETFKDTAAKFLAGMFKPGTPAAVKEQITELVNNTRPQVAISSMHGMLDPKIWNDDPVKVPAQALMAKSPFWTKEYKEYAQKIVPGLDYREFDDVGHFLFMEHPKEVNAAMVEFLRKQGLVK